ncbi:MAG: TMEM175 family protein [Bacteroidetes bacterium]|nr:TMEM175 family protein [Bacteroidota bacterium]
MSNKTAYNHKDLERITMFNDAVFAIALTLLVLELRLPEVKNCTSPNAMLAELKHVLPKFSAFLLSALLVGGNWISSFQMQRMVVRMDIHYLVWMVVYLIIISLFPFCCSLIGEYPDNPMSFVVFGGLSMMLIICAYFYMSYCLRKNLLHEDTDFAEVKKIIKMLPILALVLASIAALAFYNTKLSFIIFILWNLMPFFTTKNFKVHQKEE